MKPSWMGAALRRPSISFDASEYGYSNARYPPLPLPRFVRRAFGRTLVTTRYGNSHSERGEGVNKPISYWQALEIRCEPNSACPLCSKAAVLSRVPDHSLIHVFGPLCHPRIWNQVYGSDAGHDGSYGMIYLSCARIHGQSWAISGNPPSLVVQSTRWQQYRRCGAKTGFIEVVLLLKGRTLTGCSLLRIPLVSFGHQAEDTSLDQGGHHRFQLKQ
jgi:hypothetical protein